MNKIRLLILLIGQPLLREPARTLLTTVAVALGVAVIVAIDLAGESSTGSFRSSLEKLQGSAKYEISQVGGIPEQVFGELSRLPIPLEFSARLESFAVITANGERVPLFGVDFLGDSTLADWNQVREVSLQDLLNSRSVWVSGLTNLQNGDLLELMIDDHQEQFEVQGVLDSKNVQDTVPEVIILMDIALAQQVLNKIGRLDRIYVHAPDDVKPAWMESIKALLPPTAVLNPVGIRSEQNRKMLNAFRWNLRVLSYIAMIVGAFLIYNTVAVSVIRRRTQIGIVRALGASAGMVRAGFLLEGLFFGLLGFALGLPLGRLLAKGAVDAMSRTVESLYISSTPGVIELNPWTISVAFCAGVGISLVSALWPAREAASVPPTEAMARARLDYKTSTQQNVSAWKAFACGLFAIGLCLLPPWGNIPVAGYLAALGFIAMAVLLMPRLSSVVMRVAGCLLSYPLGISARIGARDLAASLGRTAVMLAALSMATAMMVSVGIMVGSFRETVVLWMDNQLRADLYVRPAGLGGADNSPTMSAVVADLIEALPDVEAVDRFRSYPISYEGLPATLAMGEIMVHGPRAGIKFLEGPSDDLIWEQLTTSDSVIVSEPFSQKHDIHTGDMVVLPIGAERTSFAVAGVYYDYSGEQGYLIADRAILLKYLPDLRLSNLAVYCKEGSNIELVRETVLQTVSGSSVLVIRNRELRKRAIEVFDRTFAITYALEAVAVIVAILGMAGTLLMLVIDRQKEVGVLRVLGASMHQVHRIVMVQSGLLGMVSVLMGLFLGSALSVVLIYVINKQSFGWSIQFHWPIVFLLTAMGFIYMACLGSGLYPARIAAAKVPLEALHEE